MCWGSNPCEKSGLAERPGDKQTARGQLAMIQAGRAIEQAQAIG